MQDACQNEPGKCDLARHESLSSPVVRASDQCTGGRGFDSRRSLSFCLCPTLVINQVHPLLDELNAPSFLVLVITRKPRVPVEVNKDNLLSHPLVLLKNNNHHLWNLFRN